MAAASGGVAAAAWAVASRGEPSVLDIKRSRIAEIEKAGFRGGGDIAREAEELVRAYGDVLAEESALIINTMESHGLSHFRREAKEAAQILLKDEVGAHRNARLPDLTKRLVQFNGALADCETYLRAIEGDCASPEFFTPRGGKGTAAHLRDLLPELWKEK